MKISVAMTTYIGSDIYIFIYDQIYSVFNQSLQPDELVICDDASPCDSFEKLRDMIEEIKQKFDTSINVKLVSNKSNLGFAKNFEKCIGLCTGDIIFTCDQDDIWEKDKIKIIASEFKKNNDAIMVFSDATVIDGNSEITSDSLNSGWDNRVSKSDKLELLRLVVNRSGVPYGNTTAFRKELYEYSKPFPIGFGHDEWLGFCAPLFGDVICLDKKLVKYRRHLSNTSGTNESVLKRLLKWSIKQWFTYPHDIYNTFLTYRERYYDLIPQELIFELDERIAFQKTLTDVCNKKGFYLYKLFKEFKSGAYQKFRGNRNTFIIDELYLLIHFFN